MLVDTTNMVPVGLLKNPGIADMARRATEFLNAKSWCRLVLRSHVAWAIEGVLGVFFLQIEPGAPDVDTELWVVVGDVPPAYLVTDDAPTWHDALDAYVFEMQRWVDAVEQGQSIDDVIPVNVAPTVEWAKRLGSRLQFIRESFLSLAPEDVENDIHA
jgi:hypothetical protein